MPRARLEGVTREVFMVDGLDGLGGRWELRVLVLDRKPSRKLIQYTRSSPESKLNDRACQCGKR
jgi:hypothetical protein